MLICGGYRYDLPVRRYINNTTRTDCRGLLRDAYICLCVNTKKKVAAANSVGHDTFTGAFGSPVVELQHRYL